MQQRRRQRLFVMGSLALALLAALAWVDRWWLPRLRRGPELPAARWIWAPGDWRHPRTLGFFAAADIWLAKRPAVARLHVAADEEFVVWVNATLVGSGRFDRGRPIAAFDVSGLIGEGGNRVVAELRSSRGAGGLLAWLEMDGKVLAASGPAWRIFRESRPGLLRGWLPIESGQPPQIWGDAPMARWSVLGRANAVAPVFSQRLVASSPVEAALGVHLGGGWPAASGIAPAATSWQRDWHRSVPFPQLLSAVALDWERALSGYIELDFVGEGDALLFASAEGLPDPARVAASTVIVRASGQGVWRDTVPRRFRYLLVAGEPRLVGARAYETSEPEWSATAPPVLLGVPRPPLRPAVEDKLRRELQGFASLVVRQGS